jgi:hypothetical protein
MFDLFLMAAGAGLKASAAEQRGEATANSYNASAWFNKRQGQLEEIKADYDATTRVIGAQRNRYLGMGFQLTGTPSDLAYDTISESEKDVYAIRFGARVRSENYKAQKHADRYQAVAARHAADLEATAAWVEFGTKLAGSFKMPGLPSPGGGGGGGLPTTPSGFVAGGV